jgi:GNAT superfamily N-acetyltransferase
MILEKVAIEFTHRPREQLTKQFVQSLLDRKLHSPGSGYSGMRHMYQSYILGNHLSITDIWIVFVKGVSAGIALVNESTYGTVLQLYVKHPYRGHGLGYQLAERAMAEGKPNAAYHTKYSRGIFESFGLKDISTANQIRDGWNLTA